MAENKFNFEPVPYEEAIEYFRSKLPLDNSVYKKLKDEAKTKAFSIAGISSEDVLTDVWRELSNSLEQGTSYSDFKKKFNEIWAKRGWTPIQPYRIDNIFSTNLQTAYNVGRYKQMMNKDVKDKRPYWMYDAVNDSRTRPAHRALDGKVYPADHKFWDKWYPPNGYRCRCDVINLSKIELDKLGLQEEKEDVTGKETMVEWNGQPYKIKLVPDQGWAFNPGVSQWGLMESRRIKDKGWKLDVPPKLYRDHSMTDVEFQKTTIETIDKNDNIEKILKTLFGEQLIAKDVMGKTVLLDESFYSHLSTYGHKKYVPMLKKLIEEPSEIFLLPMKSTSSGKIVFRKYYLGAYQSEDQKFKQMMVAEFTNGLWTGWTTFKINDKKFYQSKRKGILLYERK